MNYQQIQLSRLKEIEQRVVGGPEVWGDLVLPDCVICDDPADNKNEDPYDRYFRRGNYCSHCNEMANRKGRMMEDKIADPEEARMLADIFDSHSELVEKHVAAPEPVLE